MESEIKHRRGTGRERVYNFIVEFIKNNGYAPSVREICAGTDLSSTSSVYMHLLKLEDEGKIQMKKKSTRAIKVIGFQFCEDGGIGMKIDLKPCPYCGGIAKGYIKTVESFKKIHNYYVECTGCGAATERYTTEFAYSINGKRFQQMTKEETVEKAVNDWNNEIFDTQTRLLHMSEQEKILWYTADLLKVSWYGVNVLMGSLRWETAWKLRKMAEERKLLCLSSGKDYDLEVVADELLHDDTVRCIVCNYLEEIRNSQEESTNGNR